MNCYLCTKEGKRTNKILDHGTLYATYHFVCDSCFEEVKDGMYEWFSDPNWDK